MFTSSFREVSCCSCICVRYSKRGVPLICGQYLLIFFIFLKLYQNNSNGNKLHMIIISFNIQHCCLCLNDRNNNLIFHWINSIRSFFDFQTKKNRPKNKNSIGTVWPESVIYRVRCPEKPWNITKNSKIPEYSFHKLPFERFKIWPLALWPYPEDFEKLAFPKQYL